MGLIPNLEFMRINAKSLKFSSCLNPLYTKSGVGLCITFLKGLVNFVGSIDLIE